MPNAPQIQAKQSLWTHFPSEQECTATIVLNENNIIQYFTPVTGHPSKALYIDISDYSLVNLKKSNEFKNVIPSKIFENIAMYKPILLGVEGESKELINKYKLGVCFEPENEDSFLNAIKHIQEIDRVSFKANCDKMLADFDRNIIAGNLIKFIQ